MQKLKNSQTSLPQNGQSDPTASARKGDHIALAFESQIARASLDQRFQYEPLLAAHPKAGSLHAKPFLGKTLRVPMWVSSMTGGTELAKTINHNLARACRDFGMGFGLGSCRSLLHDDTYLSDFDVRHLIGDEFPLYANLGIAQVEQIAATNKWQLIHTLVSKLQADGLIIHVNPLQEWLQPEGDRFQQPPIQTIRRVLEVMPDMPIVVKEVGQGMGYQSIKALLQLPIQAIDFAANGGTNFAKLELLRSSSAQQAIYAQLAHVGHSAEEMVHMTNQAIIELGPKALCQQAIISGGIQSFLDGYYLMQSLRLPSIYGQASAFLRHARGSYDELYSYVSTQVRGLELAYAFLQVKENKHTDKYADK